MASNSAVRSLKYFWAVFLTMEKNFEMLAKTFYGMESLLADELLSLGAQDIKKGNRLVHFKGDKGFMYKANLCLRTALKILKPFYNNIFSLITFNPRDNQSSREIFFLICLVYLDLLNPRLLKEFMPLSYRE